MLLQTICNQRVKGAVSRSIASPTLVYLSNVLGRKSANSFKSNYRYLSVGSKSSMSTADLCDEYGDALQYSETQFKDYGANSRFCGKISTVKCYEDNSVVKKALAEPGDGKVLVVDGAGSFKRALLGDNVAASAIKNGWHGVVINGCVRDSEMLATMNLGIKALGSSPRKTEKKSQGERDTEVHFGGVHYRPGQYLYADKDGIVVSENELEKAKL